MGKSRLLHEFRQRIGKGRAFILQGNCSPDGKQTPFLPFIEIVRAPSVSKPVKGKTKLPRSSKPACSPLALPHSKILGFS
jgi:hypothetical protein